MERHGLVGFDVTVGRTPAMLLLLKTEILIESLFPAVNSLPSFPNPPSAVRDVSGNGEAGGEWLAICQEGSSNYRKVAGVSGHIQAHSNQKELEKRSHVAQPPTLSNCLCGPM